MDFSWGWVKPGWVVTTEPLAKAKAKAPAMRRPVAGNPAVVVRPDQGWLQLLTLPAPPE
jgi:hypothetical protein